MNILLVAGVHVYGMVSSHDLIYAGSCNPIVCRYSCVRFGLRTRSDMCRVMYILLAGVHVYALVYAQDGVCAGSCTSYFLQLYMSMLSYTHRMGHMQGHVHTTLYALDVTWHWIAGFE
jgi:hypothetical protein